MTEQRSRSLEEHPMAKGGFERVPMSEKHVLCIFASNSVIPLLLNHSDIHIGEGVGCNEGFPLLMVE